jgi:hypothetical protein
MTNLIGLLLNSGIADAMPLFLAQYSSSSSGEEAAAAAGINIFTLLFYVAVYVFTSFCGMKILEKLNYANPWLAWVPIASAYAYLEAGEQENPLMWTIFTVIPCLNIVALIKIIPAWISICTQLDKSPWLLLTIFIPCLGPFVLFGYLAFA